MSIVAQLSTFSLIFWRILPHLLYSNALCPNFTFSISAIFQVEHEESTGHIHGAKQGNISNTLATLTSDSDVSTFLWYYNKFILYTIPYAFFACGLPKNFGNLVVFFFSKQDVSEIDTHNIQPRKKLCFSPSVRHKSAHAKCGRERHGTEQQNISSTVTQDSGVGGFLMILVIQCPAFLPSVACPQFVNSTLSD